MQDFGKWMRDARTSRRKTQTECAAAIGMKLQQWNQLEKQVKRPEVETLRRVALALEMNEAEVLEAAGYATSAPEVPAELVNIWHRVPQDRRSGFLRAVRSMGEALSL